MIREPKLAMMFKRVLGTRALPFLMDMVKRPPNIKWNRWNQNMTKKYISQRRCTHGFY